MSNSDMKCSGYCEIKNAAICKLALFLAHNTFSVTINCYCCSYYDC